MAKNDVKIVLNMKGINELLMSPPLQQRTAEAAQAVQQAAGDDYEWEVHLGDYDTIGTVYSKGEAKLDDANALLKALGKVGLPLHK